MTSGGPLRSQLAGQHDCRILLRKTMEPAMFGPWEIGGRLLSSKMVKQVREILMEYRTMSTFHNPNYREMKRGLPDNETPFGAHLPDIETSFSVATT